MIDPLLLFTSFLAGILTVLAPCVLPLLPIIIGGSASSKNRWYPIILVSSLAGSIVLFTLLLKSSTLLISVPDFFWKTVSGGIILVFGLIWLFPTIWEIISIKLNLSGSAQKNMATAGRIESNWGAVLLGAAMGPVFSSCSPTYFVILATVLPVSFISGIIYLLVYSVGLAFILGLIAFFGRKLTIHLRWIADSNGLFKRVIGFLLIFVGLAVLSGFDKQIESTILDWGYGVTEIEKDILKKLPEKP